eukprot:3997392-Pyramimonas_sp.AAC.1
MVLVDNLVHGDLHPGNILVRDDRHALSSPNHTPPAVVLLDAGLCVRLSPTDQRNFIDLFAAVGQHKY